jgi:hypothetical protein
VDAIREFESRDTSRHGSRARGEYCYRADEQQSPGRANVDDSPDVCLDQLWCVLHDANISDGKNHLTQIQFK